MQAISSLMQNFITLANTLQPVFMLGVRVWIANVFWKSGVVKWSQDWDTVVFLFTEEHPVPFLPPQIAAASGLTFELLCPIFLVLGLGSRAAVLPLLAMTAVIQFTYLDHVTHYYWAFLLGMILFYGPGKFSLDHLIAKKYAK